MKIINSKSLIFLFFVGMNQLLAQGIRKHTAEKYFVNHDYSLAAPIYDELAYLTIHQKNTQKRDWTIVRRAAECNEFARNFEKSEVWYKELERSQQLTDVDIHNYVDILRYNGKYLEAEKYINQQHEKFPYDPFYNQYLEYEKFVHEMLKDSMSYHIKAEGFNSGLGEFAPEFYKDGLIFASKRRNYNLLGSKYGWDGGNFIDCYIVNPNVDNHHHHYESSTKIFHHGFRSNAHDGPISFNHDYSIAYITRNQIIKGKASKVIKLFLYISVKDDKGNWQVPVSFPYNSQEYSLGHATVNKAGNTMYFASNMPGGVGGVDIYKSDLINGAWSEPQNLGAPVNTAKNEMFPFVADDGTLYFSSEGHLGMGGLDIFTAIGDNGNFTKVENMGYPLNTNFDDFSIIVDSTNVHGFFSSNRGDHIDRIYSVRMEKLEFLLDGIVVENNSRKNAIENANVYIKNLKTQEIVQINSDSIGRFSQVLNKNTDYEITAGKETFVLLKEEIASTNGRTKSAIIPVQLLMSPTTIYFRGKVIDEDSKLPISQAKVTIRDNRTGKNVVIVTDSVGMVGMIVDRNNKYDIHADKKGYIAKEDFFETGNIEDVEKVVELNMHKIHQGDVLVIKDIFYDYNKSVLRSESYVELDKLKGFLFENPNIKVELSSHTDARGSDSYNQTLSQRRAQSCVNYLIEHGIPIAQIIAKGYGETKLVNHCANGIFCDDEVHQQNRRTEIKILKVTE